ncbi:hypothetical protein D3C77_367190 [compost metagenome]
MFMVSASLGMGEPSEGHTMKRYEFPHCHYALVFIEHKVGQGVGSFKLYKENGKWWVEVLS